MGPDVSPELPEDQLPQEVVAAFRQRYAVAEGVPLAVDQAVLADAERHLSSVMPNVVSPSLKPAARRRRVAWVSAAASSLLAAMLVAFVMPWFAQDEGVENRVAFNEFAEESTAFDSDSAMSRSVAAAAAEPRDVDGNGQIDIRDAFAVARALQAGHQTVPEWDRNSDGKVDGADVDLIALTAVTL